MKRSVILCLFIAFFSCNTAVEKPKNLIERDKMINILYDMSLLQAIKAQNIDGGMSNEKANEYLFKKYKIDSTQLAQSNKYYVSDMQEYKKMFESVKAKLDEETKKNGGSVVSQSTAVNPNTPQVQ